MARPRRVHLPVTRGQDRDTVALLCQLGRTSRLLTVKDVKLRMVAVGQPRELLTTLTVAATSGRPWEATN
jgi:hypothetical protein